MREMNTFGNQPSNTNVINRDKLINIIKVLNKKLNENNLYLDITLYGGSLMTLLYDNRPATRDIDCLFTVNDTKLLNNILSDIALLYGLDDNWFNDDIKEPLKYLVYEDVKLRIHLSNLRISSPNKEQILAMKILSARPEPAKDFIDAYLLCKDLNITSRNQIARIINKYLDISVLGERQAQFIKYLGKDLGYDW